MYVCCQLSRKDGIILLIRRDILILFDLLRIANTWAQIDSTIGISITHTVNRGFYITQVRGFNVYLISHLLFFGHARCAPSKCVYEDNRAVPRNSENEREFACWFEKFLCIHFLMKFYIHANHFSLDSMRFLNISGFSSHRFHKIRTPFLFKN